MSLPVLNNLDSLKTLNVAGSPDWFTVKPKPEWLRLRRAKGEAFHALKRSTRELGLVTVCEEASCPNIDECWSGDENGRGATATFMVMGDTCTRGCKFCHVKTARAGQPLDPDEPQKLAEAITRLNLEYIVLTSVDRDELPDQGAGHFAACVREVKKQLPHVILELLTPDFRGDEACLETIAHCGAEVLGHNVETVRRLQKNVRDYRANYDQSLHVLTRYKALNPNVYTKSAIMVGFGETALEVEETMRDLRGIGVSFFTIGQYLRPSLNHYPVKEYVHPEVFTAYEKMGEALGFTFVAAGPFVRSSYKAGELFIKNQLTPFK